MICVRGASKSVMRASKRERKKEREKLRSEADNTIQYNTMQCRPSSTARPHNVHRDVNQIRCPVVRESNRVESSRVESSRRKAKQSKACKCMMDLTKNPIQWQYTIQYNTIQYTIHIAHTNTVVTVTSNRSRPNGSNDKRINGFSSAARTECDLYSHLYSHSRLH